MSGPCPARVRPVSGPYRGRVGALSMSGVVRSQAGLPETIETELLELDVPESSSDAGSARLGESSLHHDSMDLLAFDIYAKAMV